MIQENENVMRIYLEDGELAWLIGQTIEHRFHVQTKFGLGWSALEWDKTKPMPKDVELILMKRGFLNENMNGAGI